MEKYLTEVLGVPSDRVQLLLGSTEHGPEDPLNPSRDHIIDALLSIITNSQIAYGDNIIIYYSRTRLVLPISYGGIRRDRIYRNTVPY